MDHLQFERTWEEILTHAPEFEGHRVRVTVLPEKEASLENDFDHLIGAINSQVLSPHVSASPSLFSDAVVEKMAKQGIRL